MAYSFSTLIVDSSNGTSFNMPPVEVEKRTTDKSVLYDKNLTRLDRLAGDIYEDETLWKIILWANPEYECEYDIPDGTVIRIPWPKNDAVSEVITKIVNRKNIG